MAVLSTAIVLSGSATAAHAGSPPAGAPDGPLGAAHQPGAYPNVFAQAGYSRPAIHAKLDAAWRQLFHGAPGTEPDRRDGQAVYYQLTPDMAYVEDIGNQDV